MSLAAKSTSICPALAGAPHAAPLKSSPSLPRLHANPSPLPLSTRSPHGSPPSPPPRHGAQHPSQRHQNTACKPHFKPPQRHDGAQIPPRRKPQTTTNEATGNGSNTVTKTTQR
ncbi:hypothetical protein EDB85DRAFT_1903749 [Lactarius pseudohatsudake]|nr:hypothetical protein EDB85DRAFT_1903749 [Lactarius pseudohatsudake]